ncbi:MAG: beta-ketoacyl-[acyl-carrier-protein] synthase family protein [Verrucomicrobia bacterium]|nr:beta-ketoacyl-[acyl-carrier-protein] synthase family protein [Verrucomicrobiota bacterium]
MSERLLGSRSRSSARRVAVTGLGLVTPLGDDVAAVFGRLLSGASAIAPIRRFDATGFALNHATELPSLNPEAWGISPREVHYLDRVQVMALVAAEHAVRDSGLDLPRQPLRGNTRPVPGRNRIGTAIGVSNSAYEPVAEALQRLQAGQVRQVSPHTLNQSRPCGCAALVSIRYGLRGPMLSQNAASATGALNLTAAFDAIQLGRADVMIAGGADSGVNPLCTAIFSQNLTGSRTGRCRPFDRARDGVILGEGAALVVLEDWEHATQRGARIYGEMMGYGLRSDALDMSVISEEAPGLILSIEEALEDARLTPADIRYINAHGTATRRNDVAEAAAIRTLFPGDDAPWVSGTKGQLGHLLAASGSVEFLIALLASRHDLIPPTGGLEEPDPECALRHVVGRPVAAPVAHAMTLSAGMGGMNSAIVVRGEKAPWTPAAD